MGHSHRKFCVRTVLMPPRYVDRHCIRYLCLAFSFSMLQYQRDFLSSLTKENAESVGGADLEDTVLTVPFWFTEKQRIEIRCVAMTLNVFFLVFPPSLIPYPLNNPAFGLFFEKLVPPL